MSTTIEPRPTSLVGETVQRKLTSAWLRERRFYHLRGSASLVPWIIGLFLFDLLLDWLLELPGLGRFVLLLANLGFLGWLAYHYWLRDLRRFDPARVALQVEGLHPGLHNLLVSFVQLGEKTPAPHGSPRLIEAVRQQAVAAVGPLSFAGIVDFTKLRKIVSLAAVALLLFAGSGAFAGEYYATLLVRLLNPFSERGYPTRTRIEGVTGDLAVREGDKIELQARVGGEVPRQGELLVKYGSSGWELVSLERGEEPVFSYQERKAARGFSYYFRLGDARSKKHEVTVVPPPRLVDVRVNMRYPRYTEQDEKDHTSLQLPAVVEGTRVTWELRCDQPLAQAEMVFPGEGAAQPLEMTIDEDNPCKVRLSVGDVSKLLPAKGREGKKTETISYRFRWKEKKHGFEFEDFTRYTLDVVPDQPPIVTLLKPLPRSEQERFVITSKKVLTLKFEATDDYGLRKARIAYRLNGDPETRRHELGEFQKTRSDTIQETWTLKASIPGLKEGDVLSCEIEVLDNREGASGPNVGRSRSLRLEVVSEEEYQRFVEREKVVGLDRTRTVLKDEIESREQVKKLIRPQ